MNRKQIGFFAYVLLVAVILCGCQKEEYKYAYDKCVEGYYEEYWTGGRMINKPTMDANRLEKRWVCIKYETDTLIGYRWVWKK